MGDPDKWGLRGIPTISASMLVGPAGSAAGRDISKPRTLRGQVRAGVERGAVVLLDDHGVLLAQLMGGDPAVLADGLLVEVTGIFRRDLSTTAQQGPPFEVHSAVGLPSPGPGDDVG